MSFNWFCLKSAFVWLYYYAVHLIFANFAWNLRHFQLVLMQRVFHYITPRVKGFVKMDFVKISLYNKWIIAYEHYFEGSGDILLHVRVGVYEYWQAWCRGQTNEILSQRSVRDQRLFFNYIKSNFTIFWLYRTTWFAVCFCRVQSEGPDRSGLDSLICFCTTNPCPVWCHRR